jgi:hypothetical protein
VKAADAFGFEGFLPYDRVDGTTFTNVDGSAGAAWELARRPCELASESELGELASRMAGLFRRLPEGAVCQFLLAVDGEVRGTLEEHARAGRRDGLFGDLGSATTRALEALDLPLDGAGFRARRLACWFTLKLRPPRIRAPAWLYLAHPAEFERRHERGDAELRARLDALARDVEDFFSQAGMAPRRMNDEALRRAVGRMLHPVRGGGRHPLQTHVDFDARRGAWELEGVPHALLSVVDLPTETWCGMLRKALSALPEGAIVLNVEIPDQQAVQRDLKAKKRLAFCQDRSGEADLASIRAEADGALGEMFARGVRVVRARLHLWIRSRDGRLDEACGAALNALQGLGLGAVREGPLALSLAIQCLPLAYDPANDGALKRGRWMQDLNLAHWLPLYGSFRGTERKDLTLLNRDGEVVSFSFFESDVAPHGIVCGVSGSGKSVLSNHLILHARRKGARVFVLDRGRSYEKIAALLGGRFVRFDAEVCLNPCGREPEADKLVFLTDLFAEMATGGRADLGLKERSLLSQSIRRAFAVAGGGREVTVSDVGRALGEISHPAAADLALCLRLFEQGGPYGALFDGPCRLDADAGFVVFELERIAMNKEIASVALMAILQRITDACVRDPDVEKLLIVDEAWTLLQSAATARFLENVFRTYRKYRACAVMVTQQVSDFEGPAGAAIRANAPNRCYLRQTPETVLAMERLLDLKPSEKGVLSTLRTVKGAFSEMLILSPRHSGVARLAQDPLTYWITTTDAEDNAELEVLRRRAVERGDPDPLRSALQAAALRHPGGVQAGREARYD